MIVEGHGNLLTADVEALVNTVNTVGVMGKGIALQFKRAFAANYRAYRAACDRNEVRLGQMFVFETGALGAHRYIVNFPTKQHWRSNSRLADIEAGLDALVEVVEEREISSLALRKAHHQRLPCRTQRRASIDGPPSPHGHVPHPPPAR